MNKAQHEAQLFSRPLIVGASISAGFGTRDGGPGAVLARMFNPKTQITNLASNGASSVQSTKGIDIEKIKPSIVMGFDLFFWDVVRDQCGNRFEANTRKFVQTLHEKKVALILGKIPVVDFPIGIRMASLKQSAQRVNDLLEELCHENTNSLLYDPLECFLRMDSPRYFSDGLHLTAEGNNFCANVFRETVDFNRLKLSPEREAA